MAQRSYSEIRTRGNRIPRVQRDRIEMPRLPRSGNHRLNAAAFAMNLAALFPLVVIPFRAFLTLCLLGAGLAAQVSPQPAIFGVNKRVVLVKVPAGCASVTLEQRVVSRKPGERFTWLPLETKSPRGTSGIVRFTLAKSLPARVLRVSGTMLALPNNPPAGNVPPAEKPPTPIVPPVEEVPVQRNVPPVEEVLTGEITIFAPEPEPSIVGESANAIYRYQSMVESGLWKMQGNRLVFYNELQGLQVFDVANPARPQLRGTLRTAGNAAALHVLDASHVVLLKRPADWTSSEVPGLPVPAPQPGRIVVRPSHVSSSQNSEVVVVEIRGEIPQAAARVLVDGDVLASRVVGNILYVATRLTLRTPAMSAADEAVLISAIDLTDRAHPVARGEIQLVGWAVGVVMTDRLLLAAHHPPAANWRETTIAILDISAANGTIVRRSAVVAEGGVESSACLQLRGDILSVMMRFSSATDSSVASTFSIADPSAPVPLGHVELPMRVDANATRYDGARAYVPEVSGTGRVAVIDFNDPAHPTQTAVFQAPGQWPLLRPFDDRLVALSAIQGRPHVALYNVSDARTPRLLQEVELDGYGFEPGGSRWNDNVWQIFPEKNLLLVTTIPTPWRRWPQKSQLLDLFPDNLAVRGIIDHDFSPGRTMALDASLLSIAPTRLIGVDAANRSLPTVQVDEIIARDAACVFAVGGFLLQLDGPAEGNEFLPATLNVSRADAPDAVLASRVLAALPILGATLKDGVLYVTQGDDRYLIEDSIGTQRLVVSAFDVSALPVLRALGTAETRTRIQNGNLIAHWPSPGILVWEDSDNSSVHLRAYNGPGWFSSGGDFNSPWRRAKTSRFIAFDFANPWFPRFLSAVNVSPHGPSQVSNAFATGGRLNLSYKVLADTPDDPVSRAGRHFLLRLDYANPLVPRIKDNAIMLPGKLRGISSDGQTLFTTGQNYDLETGIVKPEGTALHVSTLNGRTVRLVDTTPIAFATQPVLLRDDRIFTLNAQSAYLSVVAGLFTISDRQPNPNTSSLVALRLDAAGKFIKLAETSVAHDTELFAFGDLLVTADAGRVLHLFDASAPGALALFGEYTFDGWLSPDLFGAAGDLHSGLWVPAGEFGIETVAAPN